MLSTIIIMVEGMTDLDPPTWDFHIHSQIWALIGLETNNNKFTR